MQAMWPKNSACLFSLALSVKYRCLVQTKYTGTTPLKLQPYGGIEICILLLLLLETTEMQ